MVSLPLGLLVPSFLLGLGFFGISAVLALYNTFTPLFLAEMGLSAFGVGLVMTWDNYFNLFIQPLAGALSDRTRTRLGRRKPWIGLGVLLVVTSFAVIPAFSSLPAIMAAILLTNLGMALLRSPAVALLGDMFPPEQRSQANGIINLMGGLGAIIAFISGGALYSHNWGVRGFILQPIQLPFIFGSLLLAVAAQVWLWMDEPQKANPAPLSGSVSFKLSLLTGWRQWRGRRRSTLFLLAALACSALGSDTVQTWLSSFGRFSLDLEPGRIATLVGYGFILPSLLAAIPAGLLGARWGRRRVVLIGFVTMALWFSGGWFISNEIELVGLLALAGLSSALIAVNALPLVYDVGGNDGQVGRLTGLYYLTTNLAAIVGPPLAGRLIDLTGENYRVAFILGTMAMALAALLAIRAKE